MLEPDKKTNRDRFIWNPKDIEKEPPEELAGLQTARLDVGPLPASPMLSERDDTEPEPTA